MRPITKSMFLNARACAVKGWLERNGSVIPAACSEADQFRMEEGSEIGRRARARFPHGLLISGASTALAARTTASLLADGRTRALFEATFLHADGYVAKADILERSGGDAWDVIEVKMSLDGTGEVEALVDDLAYTVMVARRCGLPVGAAKLMLLSREYRMADRDDALFVLTDQSAAVEERMPEYDALWGRIAAQTATPERPRPVLVGHCKQCDHYGGECFGGVRNPVLNLPAIQSRKLDELGSLGIHEMADLPQGFKLTEVQRRAVQCAASGKPFVAKELSDELARVRWPAHYLDFETVMTALPLYPGMRPYEQVLTQYSVHRCSAPGVVARHSEYLAEPGRDCQRELAERLIADVDGDGSVVVYSPFESVRLKALADRFPDLAGPLTRIEARLFDLLPVIRRGFYHPGFAGSFSIKRTLPVLIPEMSYEGLGIGDGGTAVARFARMAMGQYSADAARAVRADLLRYCEQDTLAMVRLHAALLAHVAVVPVERAPEPEGTT